VNKIVFASALLALVKISSAATCTGGTLASYLSLGSGGCTIGGDTVSNFKTLSGQNGASPIAPSAVTVTIGGGSFNPSLSFSTSQSASSGSLLESIFTYDISGPQFAGTSLALSNSSETVDGAVTDTENYCTGGSFGTDGVSGCTGSPGSLLALDGIQNMDQSPLGPASFLDVTNDFTVDGGTAGTASGGTFVDSFTVTPEPSCFLLSTLGIAFGAAVRLRKSRLRNTRLTDVERNK
jgi:hypothetical protein